MKIGFIGLGTMGRHMAANLIAAGHELVVNDLRREAGDPHLAAGATWADTPVEVAEQADVVFTSLPGPPEVESVALGEAGLLKGMRPGTVYFDLSTNSPALVRRLHGSITVRDRAERSGTVFEVTLPARRPKASPAAPAAADKVDVSPLAAPAKIDTGAR